MTAAAPTIKRFNNRIFNQPGAEDITLRSCEQVIRMGISLFADTGDALAAIRDRKLYKPKYATFAEYCKVRWGMSRAHAYRLIDAAAYTAKCLQLGTPPPKSEGEAREQIHAQRFPAAPAPTDEELEQMARIRERAEAERAARPPVDWSRIFTGQPPPTGEVVDALDLVKLLKAIPLTKYSPEGGRFMIRRVNEAIIELHKFHHDLVKAFPDPDPSFGIQDKLFGLQPDEIIIKKRAVRV